MTGKLGPHCEFIQRSLLLLIALGWEHSVVGTSEGILSSEGILGFVHNTVDVFPVTALRISSGKGRWSSWLLQISL